MSTDVRSLLHDAAEAPSHAPDIEGALRKSRERRRRQRGLGALVAAVVVALVVGVVALGSSGDDSHVSVQVLQTAPGIPDGWKTIPFGSGLEISIPPGWTQSAPPVRSDGALPSIWIGTSTIESTTCPSTSAERGQWVQLSEVTANAAQANGGSGAPVTDRPTSFADESSVVVPSLCALDVREWRFVDQGRFFIAQVSTYGDTTPADPDGVRLGEQVLNTFHVEPVETTTTTTMPAVTVPPTTPAEICPCDGTDATTTTAPSFTPTTDDEAAIQQVFERWMHDHSTDDDFRATVEDADALLPSIHQGLAQHSAEDLAKYSGTVSAVRMLDGDHAEVQYTLLFGGQPQFGLRTGVAVRIDGHWFVSRATECSLLSLGGITCPG